VCWVKLSVSFILLLGMQKFTSALPRPDGECIPAPLVWGLPLELALANAI
jgi:hypothetical protein